MEGSCIFGPPDHRIAGWSTPLPSVPLGRESSPRKRWRRPLGHPRRPDDLLRPHPPVLDAGGLRLTEPHSPSPRPPSPHPPDLAIAGLRLIRLSREEAQTTKGRAGLHLRSLPPVSTCCRRRYLSRRRSEEMKLRGEPILAAVSCYGLDGNELDGRMDGFVGSIQAWVGSGPKNTHPVINDVAL
jgi:hypothetical protein